MYISNSTDFSNWSQIITGSGNISVSGGLLRLQNTTPTGRSLLLKNLMLRGGDEVTIHAVARTTSLQSTNNLILAIEYPDTVRKNLQKFNHNEEFIKVKCSWKVPTEYDFVKVNLVAGLANNTQGIAYFADLWYEIKSENLGSRRSLMDGVIQVDKGVVTLSKEHESSNVGVINASGVNIDVHPLNYIAQDKRPLAHITTVGYTGEVPFVIPVCDFTKGGVLNIRMVDPTKGTAVGITGDWLTKKVCFKVEL